MTITLSFTAGTDLDEAVQQVQNQLQSAMRKSPQAVQNRGVTVRKTGDTNILTLAFNLHSTAVWINKISPTTSPVTSRTCLCRVNGVGDIDRLRGLQYSMCIWLECPGEAQQLPGGPIKDVTDFISSQNAQIAVGQLGGTPSVDK
ncbi:efflux RND transporter permease subunit [Klebsiella pneumoniae]|nr:efflux RND transporter permease subunit [Klebsiella pneumoniae]